jgi:hypothetical protein
MRRATAKYRPAASGDTPPLNLRGEYVFKVNIDQPLNLAPAAAPEVSTCGFAVI